MAELQTAWYCHINVTFQWQHILHMLSSSQPDKIKSGFSRVA
jgi:hypothetical protein